MFDVEYARWQEENHRIVCELRAAVQEHLPENELRLFVDNCLAHYDQVMNLKSLVAKTDVFHLVSGMWKTPAERCFMWIGGFRPSELIKVHQIIVTKSCSQMPSTFSSHDSTLYIMYCIYIYVTT